MLGWAIRIIVFLLVVRALVRLIAGMFQGFHGGTAAAGARQSRGSRRDAGSAVQLVKDPVCGTYVVRAKALVAEADGVSHYFCSETCRKSFARDRRPSRSA